jgi:CRISPR-associated protein Cas2
MSEYRQMRVIILYDLPMDNKDAVRQYTLFRKRIIRMGFSMLQYSIYVKVVLNEAGYTKIIRNIQNDLPDYGNVRILKVTEKQFSTMKFLRGRSSLQEELISEKPVIVFRERNE